MAKSKLVGTPNPSTPATPNTVPQFITREQCKFVCVCVSHACVYVHLQFIIDKAKFRAESPVTCYPLVFSSLSPNVYSLAVKFFTPFALERIDYVDLVRNFFVQSMGHLNYFLMTFSCY